MFDFLNNRYDEVMVFFWRDNRREWALLKTKKYNLKGKTFVADRLKYDNVFRVTEYKEGDIVREFNVQ
jgi:hypothetical protein